MFTIRKCWPKYTIVHTVQMCTHCLVSMFLSMHFTLSSITKMKTDPPPIHPDPHLPLFSCLLLIFPCPTLSLPWLPLPLSYPLLTSPAATYFSYSSLCPQPVLFMSPITFLLQSSCLSSAATALFLPPTIPLPLIRLLPFSWLPPSL